MQDPSVRQQPTFTDDKGVERIASPNPPTPYVAPPDPTDDDAEPTEPGVVDPADHRASESAPPDGITSQEPDSVPQETEESTEAAETAPEPEAPQAPAEPQEPPAPADAEAITPAES